MRFCKNLKKHKKAGVYLYTPAFLLATLGMFYGVF